MLHILIDLVTDNFADAKFPRLSAETLVEAEPQLPGRGRVALSKKLKDALRVPFYGFLLLLTY